MYEKLNITENHLQIMTLFTQGFNKEYYIREVQKKLNLSPRTAQLILENLEKKAVLESKIKGKIRLYKLKKTKLAQQFLMFTEIYKRVCFMSENGMMREIIGKVIPNIDGIGLLFGSYVKKRQKRDSDIDLFIGGECNEKKIRSIAKMYGKEIQVKKYPLKVFKEKINEDILINEVLENHICVKNIEEFINIIKT